MATPEEKPDPHADCPPAVWNGTSYECRNHHPPIEVPRLRQPTKQLKAPLQQAGPARPRQEPMGLHEAVAATEREQKAGRDDRNKLDERIEGLEKFAEGLVAKIAERFETLEESIKGLEDSVGASQIMDNVVHVQKLYGRVLAIEEALKAAGAWPDDEPPTVHAPPTEPPKTEEPPKSKSGAKKPPKK